MSNPKGLPLKLNPSSLTRQDSGSIVAASQLAEKEVKVEFQTADGKIFPQEAKAAFTVEQLKALAEKATGIPYSKLVLQYNDKVMPDPLSISDIADISQVVKVKIIEQ